MIEQVIVRARWGSRKETIEACALRARDFLCRLANCDGVFARTWYKCGTSLNEALANNVELTADALAAVLERERAKRGMNEVTEDLGFVSGRLWNGMEVGAAHVSFECGAYPDPKIIPSPNYVWVELPYDEPYAGRILNVETLKKIVFAVVEVWEPDWARVSTRQMDKVIYPEQPYRGQQVGWLTYVSNSYGPLPRLPTEYSIFPIGDFGNVIMAKLMSRMTASNPKHVMAIKFLSDTLAKAGLLAPTPPENRKGVWN